MQQCPYCEIVNNGLFCHTIWEDEEFLAFLSSFPNTEGFSLLITKTHYPSYIFNQQDEFLFKFMLAAKKVAKLLDSKLDNVGRTGIIFEPAGIDHAHLKLIPMHGTSCIDKINPPTGYSEKYFKKYEGYLSSHESLREDDNKLEKLAKKIIEF